MDDFDPLKESLPTTTPSSRHDDELEFFGLSKPLQETQEEELGVSDVQGSSQQVLSQSCSHAAMIVSKQEQERSSQQCYSAIWSFVNEQRTVQGQCNDQNPVIYMHSVRVAKFSEEVFGTLVHKFEQLHTLNMGPVFESLFDQTLAELQLTHTLQGLLKKMHRDPQCLKEVLDILFGLINMQLPQQQLSGSTVIQLQKLIMMTGEVMLKLGPKEEADTLITLEEIVPETALDVHVPTFFIGKILALQNGKWASCLFQPTVQDIKQHQLVYQIIANGRGTNANVGGECSETMRALMNQINWARVLDTLSQAEVQEFVLVPIQKALQSLASKGNPPILLYFGKLAMTVSWKFPGLLDTCLAILVHSPWPCKILFSPLCPLLPWDQMTQEQLVTTFQDLYNLNAASLEQFASLQEEKRAEHRMEFTKYLILNQQIIKAQYQNEEQIVALNEHAPFPLFKCFRQIGTAAAEKGEGTLTRVIAQELFYFGFMVPAAQQEIASLIPQCKNDASSQLALLCNQEPALLSWVIHSIGQQLPYIVYSEIAEFFATKVTSLNQWQVDNPSINWLSYLLSHRTLPEMGKAPQNMNVDLWINTFLREQAQVEFPHPVAMNGINIGSTLLQSINWESTAPITRFTILLVILASKSIQVNSEWVWNTLLNPSLGLKLATPPFDPRFVQALLEVDPSTVFCDSELLLVQMMLALGTLDEQQQPQRVKWLEEFDFYGKLDNLVSKKFISGKSLQNILMRMLHSLKAYPDLCYDPISRLFSRLMAKKAQGITLEDDILKVMTGSLALQKDHDKWVHLWTLVLASQVPEDPNFCLLFNQLVHGLFCDLTPMEDVTRCIMRKQLTAKDIKKLATSLKTVWVAYAALLGFQPAFPKDTLQSDSAFQRALRETRFGLLRDIALSFKDGLLALPFWEQFFALYFDSLSSPALAKKLVPQSSKEQLNSHFTEIAQSFNTDSTRKVYTLYYSFTTWAKDVITPRSKGRFFYEEDPEFEDLSPGTSVIDVLRNRGMPFTVAIPRSIPTDDASEVKPKEEGNQKAAAGPPQYTLKNFLALFPAPIAPPKVEHKERENFQHFQQEVEAFVASLMESEEKDIKLFQEIRSCMEKYFNIAEILKTLDGDFLSLTSRLYDNEPEQFQVRVACNQGTNCSGPALVNGVNYKVVNPLGVKEEIGRNRDAYNKEYSAFFGVSRSLAAFVAILRYISQRLTKPDFFMPDLGVKLFFSVVGILLENVIPAQIITKRICSYAVSLGNVYVKGNHGNQENFLSAILSKAKPNLPSHLLQSLEPVLRCFTPSCLLTKKQRKAYLRTLAVLAATPTELPVQQQKILAEGFLTDNFLDKFIQSSFEEEVEVLFQVLRHTLSSAAHSKLSSLMVQSLISLSFPKHLDQVMDLILSAVCDGTITQDWNDIFLSINFEALELEEARKLLHTLTARMPLPDEYMAGMIQLSRNIMMNIPTLAVKISEENDSSQLFDSNGKMCSSPMWEDIKSFFSASIKPFSDRGDSVELLSGTNFALLLHTLRDLMVQVCPSLVNRIYAFCREVVVPYIPFFLPIHTASLRDFLLNVPWEDATFHLYDRYLFGDMNACLYQAPSLVCIVYSKLDWGKFSEEYERKVQSIAQDPIDAGTTEFSLLFWLKLHLSIKILCPKAINAQTEALVNGSVWWQHLEMNYFQEVFNGTTFGPLLSQVVLPLQNEGPLGMLSSDPSSTIVQCCIQLNEILHKAESITTTATDEDGNEKGKGRRQLPLVALAVFRETKSILFYSLQSENDAPQKMYWHLQYSDIVTLLTTVLLPLCRSQEDEGKTVSQLLIGVLECLNYSHPQLKWDSISPTVTLALPRRPQFFNSPIMPGEKGTPIQEKSFTDFCAKVNGIITQFTSTASATLALEILNVTAIAVEGHSVQIQVLEETIRAYLGHAGHNGHISKASACLQLPQDISAPQFMAECVSVGAALTLRVVLEKTLKESPAPEWTEAAVSIIAKFVPTSKHYDMDVLALWFYAVELIDSSSWTLTKSSEEKILQLHKTLQSFSGLKSLLSATKTKNSALQLASRGCLLFLNRSVLQHKKGDVDSQGRETESNRLLDQLEKLLESKKEPAMTHFEAFFHEAESFLSPQCSFSDFKATVAKTLAPTLVYLENL